MKHPFINPLRLILLTWICITCFQTEGTAQSWINPYMRTDPYSRRAERWDKLHKVPFNYSLAYNRALEAGRSVVSILRSEVAVGILFTDGTMNYRHIRLENGSIDQGTPQDTSFKLAIKPKSSYQFTSTTSRSIGKSGNNSGLLFSYGIAIQIIDWTQPDFKLYGASYGYNISSYMVGMPFSIDFKVGSEALLDRSKGSCFSIGAGLQAMLNFTSISNQQAQNNLSALPMFKMEFGIPTKIAAFKVRGTAYPGTFKCLDLVMIPEPSHYQTYSNINIKGNSLYVISLVIMPMAGKWGKTAWYN